MQIVDCYKHFLMQNISSAKVSEDFDNHDKWFQENRVPGVPRDQIDLCTASNKKNQPFAEAICKFSF